MNDDFLIMNDDSQFKGPTLTVKLTLDNFAAK